MSQSTSTAPTPELTVRVVTIEHRNTKLHHHHHHLSSTPATDPIVSIPNPLLNMSSSSSSSSTESSVTETGEKIQKKKKSTSFPRERWWWCCPWYMIIALLALIGLAIGLAVNIDKFLVRSLSPSSPSRPLLILQFNVTQKNVNATLITELRCKVSNLTDPVYFIDTVLTSWTESNGTIIFVGKNHVFNYAINCTDFTGYNFRRRLQLVTNNNDGIMPTDPVTLNISTIKPLKDITNSFVDAIWNSDALMAIAPVIKMNADQVMYYSSPSSTPSTTPSNSPSNSPSESSSITSTPTPSPSNSPSSSVSVSNTPTGTPTPTSTTSASTTVTASPGSSLTSTPTPTPTATITSTPTPTASVTATPTSTVTPSNTPSPSPTPTPATVLLEDANPGALSSYAQFYTVLSDAVYFSNFESTHGAELWVTYLTNSSTSMVVDLYPGVNGSNPSYIVAFGNKLLFAADDGNAVGNELFVSNGTAAGTQVLKDIVTGSGSSNPSNLVVFGNKVVFIAFDTAAGYELFITDGTSAGTNLIVDLHSGLSTGVFSTLFNVNDTFIFFTGNNGTSGHRLFRTDGTSSGTFMVKECEPLDNYVMFRGLVYFSADDGTHGLELWVSDGTATNTYLVIDIQTGIGNGIDYRLAATAGAIFMVGNASNTQLWTSDGTTAGSVMVMNLNITGELTVYNATTIMFAADDGGATGNELWISSGSSGTTYLVRDICPGSCSSNPANVGITQLGVAFLSADDGIHGKELFKSKATFSSTILANDIYMGSNGSDIFSPFVVNNTYLCMASNGIDGSELYLSVALPDPSPSPTPTSSPTGTSTSTSTPTPTSTITMSVTSSPSSSPTSTITASVTSSGTPSPTVTPTATRTPSITATPTGTQTPSSTPSAYALVSKLNTGTDWGNGAIEYLDRQNTNCGTGSALKRFTITRPTLSLLSYAYDCYSSSRFGALTSYSTGGVSIGDHSVRVLSGLDVSCPAGTVINRFQLGSNPTLYNFECTAISNLGTCSSLSTAANDDGGVSGLSVFLDRHNINCNAYQVLQRFVLVRPTTSTIRYDYTCCNM